MPGNAKIAKDNLGPPALAERILAEEDIIWPDVQVGHSTYTVQVIQGHGYLGCDLNRHVSRKFPPDLQQFRQRSALKVFQHQVPYRRLA